MNGHVGGHVAACEKRHRRVERAFRSIIQKVWPKEKREKIMTIHRSFLQLKPIQSQAAQ